MALFLFALSPGRDISCPVFADTVDVKEMSAKANKARWDRYRADKAAGIITVRVAPPKNPDVLPEMPFVDVTLLAVRERIEELLKAMKGAPPGCDKHATALGKLAEIERQLSGRPMPGSLKPTAPRKARSGSFQPTAPVDDDGQV